MTRILLILALLGAAARPALAQRNGCTFDKANNLVDVTADSARLVARLVDPPRARVVLSIDDRTGNHNEIVWDPALNDGLQHSVLLPKGKWSVSPSAEDERIQTGQVVVLISMSFKFIDTAGTAAADGMSLFGSRDALVATTTSTSKATPAGNPTIVLTCEEGQVSLSSLKLDKRRVAAAITARGLLDQAVPAPVVEALSLLAEVAIERAKSRAMDLVKKKFVEPMCAKLKLSTIGLGKQERALPATCALLMQLRLDDVLSSGRSLVTAARDDLRKVIAPELINKITVNDEARELARIALKFANRMIDGESGAIVEVDLLVSLLDHMGWSSGFELSKQLVTKWLENENLGTDASKRLLRAVLDSGLPGPFWDDPTSELLKFTACKRRYVKLSSWMPSGGKFPEGAYYPPDRDHCLSTLVETLLTQQGTVLKALETVFVWKLATLEHLVRELQFVASKSLPDYLVQFAKTLDPSTRKTQLLGMLTAVNAEPMLGRACAARLVVGIAKWCSSKEACSAGDVSDALLNPRRVFKPSNEFPDDLCWDGAAGSETYRLPAQAPQFIEVAVQLVSFLSPPPKGEERARAIAMVRWVFGLVRRVNDDKRVDDIESIVTHLIEGEYLRGMTEALSLAKEMCANKCTEIEAPKKALELLGAVGSYVQVYEDTKSLDPKEARTARKKAIESLIDAATDRSGRGGNVVYSFGSPVGFSLGARWVPGTEQAYETRAAAYDAEAGFQWRVPLAIARQRLPGNGCLSRLAFWRGCGTHLALWVADLGQFARSVPDDSADSVRWSDFLGLGLQVGTMLGTSESSAVIAIEASWSPGQYERDVGIMTDAGRRSERIEGAFTLGITFAYYVPFFDLN